MDEGSGNHTRVPLVCFGIALLTRREEPIFAVCHTIRLLLAVLLLLGGMVAAYAGENLQFHRLDGGSVGDDPAQLKPAMPSDTPSVMVRDVGGGTWWRGEIVADGNETVPADLPSVLFFNGGFRATITLVLPGHAQRIKRNRFGEAGPLWGLRAEIPISLPAGLGVGSQFYLHISDSWGRQIGPELLALDDYLRHATTRKVVVAASTTALLTLALLAFVLRRSFGGTAYGYLAWMACLMAGYILTLSGELHHLIVNSTLAAFGTPLQRTSAMLAVAFSHLFIISYLELGRRRPRIALVLQVFASLQLVLALFAWLEWRNPGPLISKASNLLILGSIPLVLFEAWRAHRDGLQSGRYVLWAWGPALLALNVWIFALQGWLPPNWVDVVDLVFCSMALQVAVLLLGLADDTSRLRRERDLATDQAGHDPLTGVLNRRALQQQLQTLLIDAETTRNPLSLAFLDLDHFKRVNDRYGHAAGDQCLCELVARARLAMRGTDVLARYGGEEFVLVLPGRTGAEALVWADQLRRQIAATPFPAGAQAIPVNASFGICEWTVGDSIDVLLEHADQALYRAKQNGRNQVVQWHPEEAELA